MASQNNNNNNNNSKRNASSSARSNKASKNSHGSSPSASAARGFYILNEKLRSCLRHPLAVPLIRILDDDDDEQSWTNCLLSKNYNDNREKYKVARERGETAFGEAVKGWGPMEDERKFTDDILPKKLHRAMKDIDEKNRQDSTISTAQTHIVGVAREGTQKGFTDNLLWERDEANESIAIPITLFVIGNADKYDFWQKASQGHDYVNMLRNPPTDNMEKTKITGDERVNKIAFNKHPMLLSCIVLARKENDEAHGKFGTVLCIPVSEKDQAGDFRAILLHRARTEGIENMSKVFGKILEASLALREWRKGDLLDSYEYLGPDCARIGDRLYRSYDTRLRCTDRSPDLYLWPKQQSGGQTAKVPSVGFHWYPSVNGTEIPDNEAAIKVIDIRATKKDDHHGGGEAIVGDKEKDNDIPGNKAGAVGATDGVHLFGKELPENVHKRDWLWGDQGRLLVISVPFRGGDHRARKLSDFVPILEHLKHLHAHGMVHGDVRAFNMVFDHDDEEKPKGWLIDMDFGGREGSVKYPRNFNFVLKDGRRIGEAGGLIQKYHDYYALWQVINQCHIPDLSEVENKGDFISDLPDLDDLVEDLDETKLQQTDDALSKYLKKWGRVRLKTRKVFSQALKEQNVGKPNKDG